MKTGDKYNVPNNERDTEILPNLSGLTTRDEIDRAEVLGFAKAELVFTQSLTDETVFDLDYILFLHKTALEHLYSFAGKIRTVNISKGSFLFPSAQFLEQSLAIFNKEILLKLPHTYTDKTTLIKDIAQVHAELLYIHPFREGNGRTARLLANMMSYKAGFARLKFEKLNNEEMFQQYIIAVQKATEQNYSFMEKIISLTFED